MKLRAYIFMHELSVQIPFDVNVMSLLIGLLYQSLWLIRS